MAGQLRKRFGQHLLTNPNTITSIVKVIHPKKEDRLVEIGPGRGAITIPILKKVGTLDAIEIDRDIAKEVTKKCSAIGELTIHQGDVLNFDFSQLASKDKPIRLFGNLPYNISTPLLFHLLNYSNLITDMHFMLQKEVVDRITAQTGDSNYSRLSIMLQCNYKVESLFDISPNDFTPPPKVNSSFMRLLPDDQYFKTIINHDVFRKLVETAFQQRRKTIKNSLSVLVSEEQLLKANISLTQRPQEISIPQYIELSNQLSH